jgi:hypothetical protein
LEKDTHLPAPAAVLEVQGAEADPGCHNTADVVAGLDKCRGLDAIAGVRNLSDVWATADTRKASTFSCQQTQCKVERLTKAKNKAATEHLPASRRKSLDNGIDDNEEIAKCQSHAAALPVGQVGGGKKGRERADHLSCDSGAELGGTWVVE